MPSRALVVATAVALTTSCTRRSSTPPEMVAAPDQHVESSPSDAAASSTLQDAGASDAAAFTIFDERKDVSAIEAVYKPRPDETARVTVHCDGKRAGRMYASVLDAEKPSAIGAGGRDGTGFELTDTEVLPIVQPEGPNHSDRLCSTPAGATFFRAPGKWTVGLTFVAPFRIDEAIGWGTEPKIVTLKAHDAVSVSFSNDEIKSYGRRSFSPFLSVFDPTTGHDRPARPILQGNDSAALSSSSNWFAWGISVPVHNHEIVLHVRTIEPSIKLDIWAVRTPVLKQGTKDFHVKESDKVPPSEPLSPTILKGGESATIRFAMPDQADGEIETAFEIGGYYELIP